MVLSDKGKEFIKNEEGLVLEVYNDQAGYATIGYGHLVKMGDNFRGKITKEEADQIFENDASNTETYVNNLVKVPLKQWQFDALVSFTFNLGYNNLSMSTLLKMLNEGHYEEAGEQFLRWVYAGGKKSTGLTNRRIRERKLFMEGEYE